MPLRAAHSSVAPKPDASAPDEAEPGVAAMMVATEATARDRTAVSVAQARGSRSLISVKQLDGPPTRGRKDASIA